MSHSRVRVEKTGMQAGLFAGGDDIQAGICDFEYTLLIVPDLRREEICI